MDELPQSSFEPVGRMSFPKSHVLHPDACNPTMDLVALLVEDTEAMSTQVVLMRMSGSTVWKAEVGGRVLGLAWTRDGTYLSLLVLRLSPWPEDELNGGNRSTVEHLSVYTGEVVKSVPAPAELFDGTLERDDWARQRGPRPVWWPMEWVEGAAAWPDPKPGSSLMLVKSLPRVTPVDPPKPTIINPFAPPVKAEAFKPGTHPALTTFPALLPSTPLVNPDVLLLSPKPKQTAPGRQGVRLLTGTFPLALDNPFPPLESTLGLAQRADAVERFLDVILRALQVCETTFRESEKQTMIWREELEECGQNQGISVADVHADLFRFLMASRCGPAVHEWLGQRMANRTVAKWEGTLATAFSTIQKLVHQSITPALERIILILDELGACSRDISEVDLALDATAIQRALAIASGMALLVETMRLDAETEYAAADEWCKWLRYEMARGAGSPDDAPALPTYDLKLVWSFMKNGFVCSKFRSHFPHLPEAKGDVLPAHIPATLPQPVTDLDAVMRATLARLSGGSVTDLIPSPPPLDHSFSTSMDTPVRGSPEPMSSPDTVGSPAARSEMPIIRQQELEPWSWANALVAQCREIFASFRPRDPFPLPVWNEDKARMPGEIISTRTIGNEEWIVSMAGGDSLNILVQSKETFRVCAVSMSTLSATIVQASFFDDEELALVFQHNGERYLATTLVSSLEEALTAPVQRGTISAAEVFRSLTPAPLAIARCRILGNSRRGWREPDAESWLLALNGREGRRTGFVMLRGGYEVVVLDMADEEEEEGEEETGDVEMQDSEP